MDRESRLIASVGSLLVAALLAAGCGGGNGNGDASTGPDAGSNGSSDKLERCNLGDVTVENFEAKETDDVYSGSSNRYAIAAKQGGELRQAVRIEFGISANESLDALRDGTFMLVGINFLVDGSSGSIEAKPGENLGIEAVAVNREGAYVGDGRGLWATTFSQRLGTWSGSWNLDSYEAGNNVTGSASLELEPTCATSLSSSVSFDLNFDLPLKKESSEDTEICIRADDISSIRQNDPGQLNVTIGGDDWNDADSSAALYAADEDKLVLGQEQGERLFQVEVPSPEFGENDPQGGYQTADCGYKINDPTANSVTVMDNASSSFTKGPTSGSFDLSLEHVEGDASSCEDSPLEITGDFGLAACRRAP